MISSTVPAFLVVNNPSEISEGSVVTSDKSLRIENDEIRIVVKATTLCVKMDSQKNFKVETERGVDIVRVALRQSQLEPVNDAAKSFMRDVKRISVGKAD